MASIDVHQIQSDPLGCLRRVEQGETLLVLRDEQPVAEIKPVAPPARQPRPVGLCAGLFVTPSDFDQALPDALLQDFVVHH